MRSLAPVAVFLCLVGLTLAPTPAAVAQRIEPIAIVVHPSARVSRLDRNRLAAIFTLSMRHWDDGSPIVAFNYAPRHPLRVVYDRSVLSMGADEVALFWISQRVRGLGSAPRVAGTPRIMLEVVEHLRGAIGYVPVSLDRSRVVTVATLSPEGRITPGPGR